MNKEILYRGVLGDGQQVFEVRSLDVESDADLIWSWWNAKHVVQNWSFELRLGPLSAARPAYRKEDLVDYLRGTLGPGSELMPTVMMIDGTPMGYLEVYRVGSSPLRHHPELDGDDRGFHIMIGELAFIRNGVGRRILPHIVSWQESEHPRSKRIVAEPNAKNIIAINAALKYPGARRLQDVVLPHKTAALIVIAEFDRGSASRT